MVAAFIGASSLACARRGAEGSRSLDAGRTEDPSAAICPATVDEHIRAADLGSSEHSTLFSWIAANSPLECQVRSVGTVADLLGATSDLQVIDDFCAAAATYARFLDPAGRQKVSAAYGRFPYHAQIAANYFAGLRLNRIDLRSRMRGKIGPDWTFEHPRQNAATWHYYLYLASLDTPGAYEAIAAKLAATANGNVLTDLLESLAELGSPRARTILLLYREDTRTADSADGDGPGPTISQTVQRLLDTHFGGS